MKPNRLVPLLQKRIDAERKTVLVVGDAMVDRWVHGRTECCQDGCQKFAQESVVKTAGGAANAARSVVKWGATVVLYGLAENDRITKTRYVAGDAIVFRADDDDMRRCTQEREVAAFYDEVRDNALQSINSIASSVLLSDYDKGFMSEEFIRRMADACRECGVPCVADCKREPHVYEGCVLKGNASWSRKFEVNLLSDNLVLTFGDGCPTVSGRSILADHLPPVRCVNHVGAGDCFAAHLALALAYGFSLKDAAALAYSAGRVYVQHPHNRPPHPDEVAADLSSGA